MSVERKPKHEGVVLAADVGSYSISSVALAVQMAASVNTHLCGVFIEDEDLLQVVGLPCSREISLTTARERPTSVAIMRSSLRAVAQQFRQALQQQAQERQIDWSFDYRRGRLRDFGLSPGAPYLILGHSPSRPVASTTKRGPRRILLLAMPSSHQKQALRVALELFGQEIIELTLTGQASADDMAEQIEGLRENAVNPIRLIDLERARLFDLLERQGRGFDCAILPQQEKPEELLRILKALGCPVILTA